MSVRARSTLTTSLTPNRPFSDTVYCPEDPSSPATGPVIDQAARLPVDKSSIVVVTDAAAASTVTAMPVLVVGLLNSSAKSSGPSVHTSALIARSITKSVIEAPSAGAV